MSIPIQKIVSLFDLPLDKRFFEIFGIETLLRNGFDVEVWDMTPYFHRELVSRIVRDGEVVYENCKTFETRRDIAHALSEITPGTLVNSHISYQHETFFIYRLLSKYRIAYCVVQMISLPPPLPAPAGAGCGLFGSLAKKFFALKPKNAVLGLIDRLLLKYYFLFGIRPADYALLSGERSFEILRDPISEKTTRIWCHGLDYDTYLTERDHPVTTDPSLGIFLDEYYPLHSDLAYLGITTPIGPDEYYAKLRTFFDELEKCHHVRIVIAAHPRSDYPASTPYFGGREIVKGQTARLVHASSFVLAHDSTSMNFAVLFRKPIIFLTMDKMQQCDAGRLTTAISIESMARALGKLPINLDTMAGFDWDRELQVDMGAYARYQNDIIKKSGTPEMPFWEIYSREIRKPRDR